MKQSVGAGPVSESCLMGAAVLLLASAVADAQEAGLDYALEIGVLRTDNVTRVSADEIGSTAATARIDLTHRKQGSRLESQIDVGATLLEYFEGPYSSDVVGGFDAELAFAVLPERFVWRLEDAFGQAAPDPFQPATAENRENVNYFSTGPVVTIGLGPRMRLRAYGEYSLSDFERSPYDGDRLSGGLGLVWPGMLSDEFSINVSADRLESDREELGAYDRQAAFMRIARTSGRTRIALDAGYNVLRDGGESTGSPLLELELVRNVTAASTLTLGAASSFSSAGEAISTSEFGPVGGSIGQRITSSSDMFEIREVSAVWDYRRVRNTLHVAASRSENRYQREIYFNRNVASYTAHVGRWLRPALRAQLGATLIRQEFPSADLDDDERIIEVQLTWALGLAFGVNLSYQNIDHDASNPALEFSENRILIGLSYSSTRHGSQPRARFDFSR